MRGHMSENNLNSKILTKAAAILIAFVFAACAFPGTAAEVSVENLKDFNVTIKAVGEGTFTVGEDDTPRTEYKTTFENLAFLNIVTTNYEDPCNPNVLSITEVDTIDYDWDSLENVKVTAVPEDGYFLSAWFWNHGIFGSDMGFNFIDCEDIVIEAYFAKYDETGSSFADLQSRIDNTPAGGTLTLDKNYVAVGGGEENAEDVYLSITKDITIDLGNYTIRNKEFDIESEIVCGGNIFKVDEKATLTIRGGNYGLITSAVSDAAVIDVADGKFVLESGNIGAICGGGSECNCIHVGADSQFTMNGGRITGCSTSQSSVFVAGKFVMNGGTFSSTGFSGNIRIDNNEDVSPVVEINGGLCEYGGGPNLDSGAFINNQSYTSTVTVNNITFSHCMYGNFLQTMGGDVIINDFVAENCYIQYNMFHFNRGTNEIKGGSISNCVFMGIGPEGTDQVDLFFMEESDPYNTRIGGITITDVFVEGCAIKSKNEFVFDGAVIKNSSFTKSLIECEKDILFKSGELAGNTSGEDTFIISGGKTMVLGGTIVIRDNQNGAYNPDTREFSDLTVQNLLPGQAVVSTDFPLTDGASIFVTDDDSGESLISGVNNDGSEIYFHLDGSKKVVVYFNGDLVVADAFGECGDGLEWEADGDKLVISGDGLMIDYPEGESPWAKFAKSFSEIVIGKDVKHIGENAFFGCSKVKNVVFDGDRPTMGKHCFALGTKDDIAYFTAETPGWDPAQVFNLEYYVGSYSVFIQDENKETSPYVIAAIAVLAIVSVGLMAAFAIRRK